MFQNTWRTPLEQLNALNMAARICPNQTKRPLKLVLWAERLKAAYDI